MRDIRPDLKERLSEAIKQQSYHQRMVQVMTERIQAVEALLKAEDAQWSEAQQQPLPGISPDTVGRLNGRVERLTKPMSRFVIDILSDGIPRPLSQLKQLGEERGLAAPGKHFGRALHFTLVGLQQNDYVRRMEDGRWAIGEGVLTK